MNFVPELRMNNIMPGNPQGYNPFGAPNISGGGIDFNAIINAAQNIHDTRRQQDIQQEDNLHRRAMGEHLQELARNIALQRQQQMGAGNINSPGMNWVYGGEIPQTKLNGETLQQASARVDADNDANLSVKPQYIPAEDQPGSQKSKLEVLGQQIAGQKQVAAANATSAMARQVLSGNQAKERTDATIAGANARNDASVKQRADKDAADNKAKADLEAAKLAAKKADDSKKGDAVKNMAQTSLDSLNELIDDKGNLKDDIAPAVGGSRVMGLQYLPGSQTMTADQKIKNFKAQNILNLIGELKSQSKTGATGFGNMSVKELGVLESAAGALNPQMNEKDFAAQLVKIREKLKKIVEPAATDTGDKTKTKMTADDYIKKYGG